MERILIVGYTTRQIAQSAVKAGFRVYCIDRFLDLDLLELAEQAALLDERAKDFGVRTFLDRIDCEIEGIIIGSGCERIELDRRLRERVIGNSPDLMQKISDKAYVGERIIDMGFSHPEIYTKERVTPPAVIKPLTGGGGLENRFIREKSEIEALEVDFSRYLIQEYVEGIPVSVSLVSNEKGEVESFCVNEQLIGIDWLNAPSKFAYCGNIVPFETELASEICEIAEEIIRELGLIGSNGVDFVISDEEAVVIEVNPRFQGSIEALEIATGCNIFDCHVKACCNEPFEIRKPLRFGMRAVVYAKADMAIGEDLRRWGFSDVPAIGTMIPEGEPVASVLGYSETRSGVIQDTREVIARLIKR
ncbi:MAG: ATP-grasp domain-containing protein [Candidatus Syntrophoarchaeum sp.]|nr:ATP-grasp domain-containing protein [Candidatus Syntrophoarchaeum sp.]